MQRFSTRRNDLPKLKFQDLSHLKRGTLGQILGKTSGPPNHSIFPSHEAQFLGQPRTVREIAMDGDCFPSAISQAIRGRSDLRKQIRKLACDYLSTHPKLVLQHETHLLTESDVKKYIANSRRKGQWVGTPEIVATTEALNMMICVFITDNVSGKASWVIHAPSNSFGDNGRVYLMLSGQHYELVVAVREKTVFQFRDDYEKTHGVGSADDKVSSALQHIQHEQAVTVALRSGSEVVDEIPPVKYIVDASCPHVYQDVEIMDTHQRVQSDVHTDNSPSYADEDTNINVYQAEPVKSPIKYADESGNNKRELLILKLSTQLHV